MLSGRGRDVLLEKSRTGQSCSIVAELSAQGQLFGCDTGRNPGGQIPTFESAVDADRRACVLDQRTQYVGRCDDRRVVPSREVECQRRGLAGAERVGDRDVELIGWIVAEMKLIERGVGGIAVEAVRADEQRTISS